VERTTSGAAAGTPDGPGTPGPSRPADVPVPDFARVFDLAPAPFLLLTPDFVIVHANRARLEATATTLEQNIGRHLFDLFPDNPQDPAADGTSNVAAALARARDTRRPVTMPIQKYDIRMPDGSYQERFWSPLNVPILDDDGEVVLLLHRADDITEYIRDRDEARREAARGQHRV
jgi:PAS domain-containing protein